jgi:hypothetical protein
MARVLSNSAKVYLDSYDMTVSGLEADIASMRPSMDKTSLADTAARTMAGRVGRSEVSYGGLLDTVAGANFAGIKALVGGDVAKVISIHYGQSVGKRARVATIKVAGLKTAVQHNTLLPISADLKGQSAPSYQKVIYPKATVTGTTSGAKLDNGAASTAGLKWAYHVIAITGVWSLKVQAAATTASTAFADVAGPSVTAIGAAILDSTGTAIARHLRFVPTKTSTGAGSLTVAVSAKRK